MSFISSVIFFIVVSVILFTMQLSQSVFAIFYHFALAKKSSKAPHRLADNFSLFYIFGNELFYTSMWLFTYFILYALFYSVENLTHNIFFWVLAGILIACISTNGVITSVGECLGRGTIISMVLVMCVLPQLLLIGNKIIDRTSFTIKKPDIVQKETGTVFVNGRVRGRISGVVDAEIHGILHGELDARVRSDTEIENETTEEGNYDA